MPGIIPTQYQNPNMKSIYTNADLNPSLSGLRSFAQQVQDAQAPIDTEEGSQEDSLLASAQKTLDTPPPSSYLKWQHQTADDAAAREQHRTEQAGNYVNPVANAVQDVTGFSSMIPGPIGVGSKAAFALAGLAKAGDPTSDAGVGERLGDAAIGTVPELIGEGRAAFKASKQAGLPGRVWGGASRGSEIGAEFADKQSSIPAVQHYWDALDLGQEPAQALKTGAGRDKGARTALEALQRAGKGSEGVAEEAARSVPSTLNLDQTDLARSVPGVDANSVFDEGRVPLGSQGYDPGLDLGTAGSQKYATDQYSKNHDLAVSLLGDRVRTPEEVAARLSSENPLAWKPDMVDMPNGSTVPGNDNGGTPHPGAGMDNASLRALRDAAQARYAKQVETVIPNNLEMPTAQEALINDDEASRRSTMFGGVGSKQKGSHVRPKNRTPVGAK